MTVGIRPAVDPAVESEIVELLQVGGVPERIARELDVPIAAVRRIAIAVTTADAVRARNRTAPEIESEIMRMYHSGARTGEIMAALGVSRYVCERVSRDHGRQGRSFKPMTPDELDRARNLLECGASYGAVARILGRSHTAIATRFPGYGWPPGRSSGPRQGGSR